MTKTLVLRLTQFSCSTVLCTALLACGSSGYRSLGGTTSAHLASWNEPAPHGMVHIPRGHVLLGDAKADSLWGTPAVSRGISVEAFWMDRTEVTNAQYRQFVYYVRDSIIRERLADPA